MTQIKCPDCGEVIVGDVTACPRCGCPIDPSEMPKTIKVTPKRPPLPNPEAEWAMLRLAKHIKLTGWIALAIFCAAGIALGVVLIVNYAGIGAVIGATLGFIVAGLIAWGISRIVWAKLRVLVNISSNLYK